MKALSTLSKKILEQLPRWLLLIGTIILPLWYLPFTRDTINAPKELFLFLWTSFMIFSWLLRVAVTKVMIIRRTVLDIPMILLFALVLLSSFLSLAPSVSMFGRMNEFVLHAIVMVPLSIWAWMIIQEVQTIKQWRQMIGALVMGTALSALIFIFGDMILFRGVATMLRLDAVSLNTISRLNSVFGLFVVSVGILSIGALLHKSKNLYTYILPASMVIISIVIALYVGFPVIWSLFAFGLGLLIVLGWLLVPRVHTSQVAIIFILFIGSLLFAIFGSPQLIKQALPAEVTLGFGSSLQITQETLLEDVKHLLIGSGPGTFVYSFSSYRPAVFNLNQLVWSIRFAQPFNTLFAIVTEIGLIGTVGFLVFILVLLGLIVAVWKEQEFLQWRRMKNVVASQLSIGGEKQQLYIYAFSVAIAWAVTTVSMVVVFFDVSMWWLWWWLVGMVMVGMGLIHTSFIHPKKIKLSLSPQHALLVSFGMVVTFTLLVIFDAYAIRFYVADVAFTKAIQTNNLETSTKYIEQAMDYRADNPTYHMALSRVYLGQARLQANQVEMDERMVAGSLAKAVNNAKIATDLQPYNAEMWDMLSLMYVNARTFAPDANGWAKDAVERAMLLEPTNPVLWLRLGTVHEFDEKREDAIDAYIEAIRLKPDYVAAYMNLSGLYEIQGDIDNALLMHSQVLAIDAQHVDALYHAGRLFYNRNIEDDNKKAEQAWKATVDISPQYANALYSLGVLYEKRGDVENARVYYKQLQVLHPENEDIAKKLREIGN